MAIYYNGELVHHGTKGMRWGRRRYQNEDGSLTPAGVERYRKLDAQRREAERRTTENKASETTWARQHMAETVAQKKLEEAYVKATYKPGKLETARDAIDASSKAVDAGKKLANMIPEKKAPRMDLSSMSDQELRAAINREMMERQYNDMFAPKQKSRGKQVLRDTLEVAGGVLAVGASAVTIALAIKQMKGK